MNKTTKSKEMTKTEIIDDLKNQIDIIEDVNGDMDDRSWQYEKGVLLSVNQANLLIKALNTELPSDDEIEKQAKKISAAYPNSYYTVYETYMESAKWMRNKIKEDKS